MKKLILSLTAIALVAGCQKSSDKPAEPAPAAAQKLADAAPTKAEMKKVEAVKEAGAKELTEEKLKAFIVYEREMLPHTKLAMGMAIGAFKKAGKDMAKEISKDERRKVMEEAAKAALAKSGLDRSDIPKLSTITAEYYTTRVLAMQSEKEQAERQKRMDEAKAAGKEPGLMDKAMFDATKEQLDSFEADRQKFVEKYGKETVELLEKYVEQFAEIHRERMNAILPSKQK
ncbi:MAG: hypothetical protein ACOX6T_18600 [Myxococcales bacterium]|jgi:Sec-independent protein translocase protein TatA